MIHEKTEQSNGPAADKRFIDISGEFDFSYLEIRPTTISSYWYFYNSSNKCFGDTFILTDQDRVQKLCRLTLIEDSGGHLVPRFDFFISDKEKQTQTHSKEENERLIRAKVNLESKGSKSFWKLIGFLLTISKIKFDNHDKYKVYKSDAEIAELLKNKQQALTILSILGDEGVQKLNTIIGVGKIIKVLSKWNSNKTNADEEFWQKEFQENPWLISQIFACPYIFIEGKPFFGGKRTDNHGGVIGDLLFKNIKTENAAFIEIKTPETPLIKSMYRGKDTEDNNTVFSMSEDLSGGITQVLNQKGMQLQKRDSLEVVDYKNHNSKCILIVGNTEKLSISQMKSFDLFRNSNKDVEIITFDELFLRIEMMKKVFEEDVPSETEESFAPPIKRIAKESPF